MAIRTYQFNNNFTSGEISPKLRARVDLDQYKGGCETMENFLSYPHGGCRFRPGFKYVADAKYFNKKARLIPFQFSREQAYIIEAGDEYFNFYRNNSIIVEAVPPAVLNGGFESGFTDWDQTLGDGGIQLETVTQFYGDNSAFIRCGASNNTDISQDGLTTEESTFYFLKFWTKGDGTTAGEYAIYDVSNAGYITTRTTTGISDADWTKVVETFQTPASCIEIRIEFYPGSTDGDIAYFDNIYLEGYPYEISSVYQDTDIESIQWAQSADILFLAHPDYHPKTLSRTGHTSWSLDDVDFYDGPWLPENLDSGMTVQPSATTGTITVTSVGFTWDDGHEGALWRIKVASVWGYVKFTTKSTDNIMNATVIEDLDGTAATEFWREGAWSDYRGFPRAVSFHEERLAWAGSGNNPQTIWMSASADFTNHVPGVETADAINLTIASDQMNAINWIASTTVLLVGTANGEFRISGGSDDILTPTSINAKNVSNVGSLVDQKGIRVNNVILYPQTAGRKLVELRYYFEEDAYIGRDISLMSEHITEGGFKECAYQQEPDSTFWMVRADGVLLSMTYKRREKVEGWARHLIAGTDAKVESIAVIPSADASKDELWAIISLTIDGGTVRYIEYLTDDVFGMDHFLTYQGAPATSFANMDHIEGETVTIVGDDALYPDEIIDDGKFEIDAPAASEVHVGVPFSGTVKTLRPEVQLQTGSTYNLTKSFNKIVITVFESLGGIINGETLLQIDPEQEMGTAQDPFTGDQPIIDLGWDVNGQVTVIQEVPFQLSIQSIGGSMAISEEL